MELVFIIGSSSSGKTRKIKEIIKELHAQDPFSYLFVGPTGAYTKTIREELLDKLGTVISSRFLPVDHFAVEVMRRFRPEMLHIDNHVARLLISEVLEELDKKELSGSPVFVEYIIDMIHDVKENGGFDKLFSQDDETALFLQKVFDKFSEKMLEDLYDTFDAYLNAPEFVDEIEFGEFGEVLILDGFHDFTPALRTFLSVVSLSFKKVYITVTEDERRKDLFSETESIFKFADDLIKRQQDLSGQPISESRIYLDNSHFPSKLSSFFENFFAKPKSEKPCENVKVVATSDVFSEVEFIAKEVKTLIERGYEPGDIAIVTEDFNEYDKLLSKKLEEYTVPFRSEGDTPLQESLAVRMLLLPLEAAVSGYRPEKLMAMADFGYGGLELDTKLFESVMVDSRLYYDFRRESYKKRLERWTAELQKYRGYLLDKLRSIEAHGDEEFLESEKEPYEMVLEKLDTEIVPAIKEIFKVLEPFKSVRKRDCRLYGDYFRNWDKKLNLTGRYKETGNTRELRALDVFFNRVIPDLEKLLIYVGKERLNPSEYYKYLSMRLKNESFKEWQNFSNRVEIQTLLNARFSKKKIKFFAGFKDGSYPSIKLNPLYSFTQYSENRPKDLLLTKEKQQRLNFFLAVNRTTELLYFTYPESTIDGEPLLPSPYMKEVLSSSLASPISYGRAFGKKEGIIPELSQVMSSEELKVASAQYFTTPLWDKVRNKLSENLPDGFPLEELEQDLMFFHRPFDWKVSNVEIIEKLVGRTFSYSRLSTYNKCSFKFFLSYILKLSTEEEHLFELSPLDEGNLYHAVLKEYFEGKEHDLDKLISNQLKIRIKTDKELVFRFEHQRLKEVLEKYLYEKEAKKPPKLKRDYVPTFFEISFGSKGNEVEIISGIYLRGKIDRIDINEESKTMYIIDYKRGGNSGDKEQLILYTIAAKKLFENKGYTVEGGTFRPLRGDSASKNSFIVIPEEDDLEGEIWKFGRSSVSSKEIKDWITRITGALFSGIFKPEIITNGGACFNCYFSKSARVCPVLLWRKSNGGNDYEY
ncbi:hypothetical protein IX53_07015 [Kosmotoga pacifica]|uniref:Uncharacterized protein n=2 Tax=Kosmotoga pacifica TaxID=1330330 RepID=A0A0G2Z9S3_9BACT|nr:hypothetical protein IX53_07015 [Kosmotoga pacifica]